MGRWKPLRYMLSSHDSRRPCEWTGVSTVALTEAVEVLEAFCCDAIVARVLLFGYGGGGRSSNEFDERLEM